MNFEINLSNQILVNLLEVNLSNQILDITILEELNYGGTLQYKGPYNIWDITI